MRKPAHAETKTQISYVATTLISVSLAVRFIVIVVSMTSILLNPKFQAS